MFKDDDDDDEATMGAVRYPVMPSLVALQQMRNRLHLAYLGKKLMKWTALATGKELRRMSFEIAAAFKGYNEKVREAFICLARCRYFVPNMNHTIMESLPNMASIVVKSQGKSIAGVKIKTYGMVESGIDPYPYLGLNRGGTAVASCKKTWLELLRLMVLIQQLRSTFEQIETANKNATKLVYDCVNGYCR